MRLTKHMTALPTLLFTITYFAHWYKRQRQRKAIEMRIAMLLRLGLMFSVTAALVYSQEVHYNYDRGANFAALKTYQWIEASSGARYADPAASARKLEFPGPPASLPAPPSNFPGGEPNFPGTTSDIRSTGTVDQLIDQDIRRAVDEQLTLKGLTKVEKNADLQVIYHSSVHQEVGIDLSGTALGDREYGSSWNGSLQGRTSTIPVGMLVVDLYDPARKQLIWRGDATKTVNLKTDPDKNYKNLQKTMAKLFKNYPPKPSK